MRRCVGILAVALLPALMGMAPSARAVEGEVLYEKLARSVTAVFVPRLTAEGKPTGRYKIGAGVLIDADKRLVLTSHAVVREGKQVAVSFPIFDKAGVQMTDVNRYLEIITEERGSVPGEVIANSKTHNLAIIRLAKPVPSGSHGVKIAASSIEQASAIWGFGHPISPDPSTGKMDGQMFQITLGTVRSIGNQEVIAGDGNKTLDFRVIGQTISVTNPLNRGDEGGPMFNSKGELVGVQIGAQDIREAQQVSLAVDVEEINKFLADNKITAKGTVTIEETTAAAPIDTEALYKKAVQASVFITSSGSDGGFSMGSGSLIDLEKRLIVTNYHVVDKEEYVHVQFPFYEKGKMVTDKKRYIDRVPDGKAIKGVVQFRDPVRDLAIVKLNTEPPAGTTALPLAEKSVAAGTTVWNIGSPGKVDSVFSTTRGIVRCNGLQKYEVGGGADILKINARIVMVTLATNPGDSGGPIINAKGELVAVHHAGQPGSNLLSASVDISELKSFMLEKGYEVKGVQSGTVTKKDPPKKDNTTPPKKDTPAVSNDEKAADTDLRLAKTFANNEDAREKYKEKLAAIVKKYPETMAGKEAKRILATLM